jgi:hypothetical protein
MNLKLLKQTFEYIGAIDALDLLCWHLGATNRIVYVDGSRFVLSDLYDYADEWMQLNAKDIILSFYGGPPPTRWWKNSTLLTMLLDYIIYAEKRGNKKAIRTALAIVQ